MDESGDPQLDDIFARFTEVREAMREKISRMQELVSLQNQGYDATDAPPPPSSTIGVCVPQKEKHKMEALLSEITEGQSACKSKISEFEDMDDEAEDIERINAQDDIILSQQQLIDKMHALITLQATLLSSSAAPPATAAATTAATTTAPAPSPAYTSVQHQARPQEEEGRGEERAAVAIAQTSSASAEPAGRRRGGVSAEVPQASSEPFTAKVVPKSLEAETRIKSVLRNNILFVHLDDAQMKVVVDAMFQVRIDAGTNVITQGEAADSFYIIESGECDVYVSSGGAAPKLVLSIGAGKSFGELALMYNCPRAATVKAKSDVVLWAVDRMTFQHIVLSTTGDRRKEYCSFLSNVSILGNCSDEERNKIADVLAPMDFKDGDFIVREGEEGDCFYIIVSGDCVCTKLINGTLTEVKRLTKGDYFGELALMRDQPRAANVIAHGGPVKVVSMDRASFMRLLGPCEDIIKRNIDAYELEDLPEDTPSETPSSTVGSGSHTQSHTGQPEVSSADAAPVARPRRGGVSAEVHQEPDEPFVAKVVPKSVEAKLRIKNVLRGNILFQHLDDAQMKVVVDAMFSVDSPAGTNVITQGDSADSFYIIESGECDVYVKAGGGNEPKLVLTIGPGKSFGELALMYNCPRAATVRAKTDVVLWAVDRLTFQHIVLSTTGDRRKMYNEFLENVPILNGLTDEERSKIADVLSSATFEDGEFIVRQDEEGDNFYIIEAGEAVCTKSIDGAPPIEVKRLKKGDYFGELALLRDQPRAANVVANGPVKAVSMDRASFVRLLGPAQKIMERTVEDEYNLGSFPTSSAVSVASEAPAASPTAAPAPSAATSQPPARGRRGGVSAEVPEESSEPFVPKVVAKSVDAAERITNVLKENILFVHLDENQLSVIVQSMERLDVPAGDNVITQGDPGESFYIIESGECDVFVSAGGNPPRKVLTIGAGKSFGELALMYNCSRAATVTAKTACVLWAIDRLTFQHMVLKTTSDKRDLYNDFLKAVPILVDLNPTERSKIADVLASQTFEDGEYIVRQDEEGNNFYIIESGDAVCTKSIDGRSPIEVKRLTTGDYFGELALLKDQPRAANVIAHGRVKTLSMDRASFIRLLGPVTDIMERNTSNYGLSDEDD